MLGRRVRTSADAGHAAADRRRRIGHRANHGNFRSRVLLDVIRRHRRSHRNHERLFAQLRRDFFQHFADDLRLHSEQNNVGAVNCLLVLRRDGTPNSFASADAFSECFTVAVTFFGSKRFCFRYARSRIPPSLPVPSTASFLSARWFAERFLLVRLRCHSPNIVDANTSLVNQGFRTQRRRLAKRNFVEAVLPPLLPRPAPDEVLLMEAASHRTPWLDRPSKLRL